MKAERREIGKGQRSSPGLSKSEVFQWLGSVFQGSDEPKKFCKGGDKGNRYQRCFNIWDWHIHTAAAAKSLQSCPTLCDLVDGSLLHPWDSPGKNAGVGCHFLLQCMKVKSESEVTQLCLTLCDPMDCSLPGSSIHGSFQARVLEWVAIAFSRETPIFP